MDTMRTFTMTAQDIWDKLRDIPVTDDGAIQEALDIPASYGKLSFPVGTDREDIWHWLEDEFNLSITEL